ncbi:hypothetical protein D3C85_13460 [compost metagenome]
MEKKVIIDDQNSDFFVREETIDTVHWKVARYPSDVSNSSAVKAIKQNGYMRIATKYQPPLFVKVSVLLKTDLKGEVERKINTHMGF